MKALIKQLLAGLYIKIRGGTSIQSRPTGLNYAHAEPVMSKDGVLSDRIIRLRSIQYAYLIQYKRWYIPNRVEYSYRVEISIEEGGQVRKNLPPLHYPHFCSKLLWRTRYPHVCAINACLDRLIEMNLASKV